MAPVEATIPSKRIDENSDGDGGTYCPVVVHRYYVGDGPYTSSRVLPIAESHSGGWAYRIIAQYDLGAHTAWHDPANTADSYLRRSRSVVAPIFTAIGACLIVAAMLTARFARR